ncbi:hypothetical protein OV208_30035 [Corallococcus sp. bb12-1]|uniref:hypothetical protein n=1 Tax=Corallococcus sp. bb12-1 TaxID=2996784 RepID=UPI00226E58FA|nr:hypothetical protein [Corallococcus sp. bb12-1]MCY1045593.1 hypothetical protein [Corallococcus sp. bb12-1]
MEFELHEVGYREASTFTGFCAKHDGIFAPVENKPFVASREQGFLLGYRSVCMELFKKQTGLGAVEIVRNADRGRSPHDQFALQFFADGMQEGLSAAIGDLKTDKSEYDRILVSGDYVGSNSVVIRLDQTPDVMCSGLMSPEYDLSGNILQVMDGLSMRARSLAFSLTGVDVGGAAVFQWVGDNPPAKALAMGFAGMPRKSLPDALYRFSFEFIENVFVSPVWWRDLPLDSRKSYMRRAGSGVNPMIERRRDCLGDDGVRGARFGVADVVCHY